MSKIVIRTKRGKTLLTNRLSYPETVNEWVHNAITAGEFSGVLPVSVEKKRKETRVLCSVQGLIPLDLYFAEKVTKKMFLDLAQQIVRIIRSCESNMVSANNLDLQRDRIFVDPFSKSVSCVYWPVVNNRNSTPPHLFLKQLPYDLSFDPNEDSSYLEQYVTFFGGNAPFSLNSFERMLLRLEGKESNDNSLAPSDSGRALFSTQGKKKEMSKEAQIAYDPIADEQKPDPFEDIQNREPSRKSGVFCPVCGAENIGIANYCSSCGNLLRPNGPIPDAWQMPKPPVLPSDVEREGTVVLRHEDANHPNTPTLMRKATGERYIVSAPVFRIGAEPSCCDFVISDNTFISRSHADILTKDGRYFLVDRRSTNKTWIDGQSIPPETEYELFNGTEFKLADETFSFSLE